jgi:hypothetical protein
MATDAVLFELLEDVGKGVLADLANGPGRQLVLALFDVDEARVFEHLRQLGKPLQAGRGVVAE